MGADSFEGGAATPDPSDSSREHPQSLRRCVREAFGLAKGGGSARGYQVLRAGRECASPTLHPAERAERLAHWNTALRWYERFVPPPF
jgi:hypothetical protein